MRKRDIHVLAAYAVGAQDDYALRATVLGQGSCSGSWQVRFDEEVVTRGWGSFRSAEDLVDRSKAFFETEVESRQVRAPWDDFIAEQAAREERAQAERERLSGEKERVRSALERLEQALCERGFELGSPRCVLSDERIHVEGTPAAGVWTRGKILLVPELLDYVVSAVEQATTPERQSALADLLELGG